ncbi:phage tail tape measure protein [Clostridium baratii]|uniref:phage tail tape measure protein n=1 Tax=Clostridium baratii TaxID=1561 RepID=UPI0030D5F47D
MAGANIKIGANSSDFQRQMKEVVNQLKVTQSQFGLASEKAKLFGNTTDQLKAKQGELANKLKSQNTIVAMSRETIRQINKEIIGYKNSNEQLAKKIADTEKKQKEAVEVYGKGSKEVKELDNKLKELKEEYAKNEKAIESSNKKIDTQKIKLNESEKAILHTKKAIEENNKALEKMGDKFAKAGEKAGKVSDKMKPASLGIAGLGVVAAKTSMDFEESMAKVDTIADTTQVPLNDLKKGIMDLSNQTGISSNEIANNVYDAISAGQKTGDAVNFVSNSTKLAKAGFAEAGQSLDILTTILNSYGMKASEVTKVSDTLIQTQNLGKVTVGELSADMGKVIPTAKSLGVNLSQVASGYAIMTAKGVKSAETTTYMNSMLNELGKNGTIASKALQSATGKSFPELIKSGKSVGDVLNSMNKYAKKNKKSLADMFGSVEAGKAALLLSENGGKDFNNMLAQMNQSAGATQKAFDKMSHTTQYSLKGALNQATNSLIGFGDVLAPFISLGSQAIASITKCFSGLSQGQKEVVVALGATFIGTNLLLGGFSKLSKGLKDNIKFAKDTAKAFKNGANKIKDFTKATKEGNTFIGKFAKGISKCVKSIADFTVKIVKATAKGIVNFTKALGKGIVSLGKFTLNLVKATVKGLIGFSKGVLKVVLGLGKLTLSLIKNTAVLIKNGAIWVANKVKMLAFKAAQLAVTAATNAMTVAQKALNLAMSMNPITIVVTLLLGLAGVFVVLYTKCEWFRNGVQAVWSKIQSVFRGFANFLSKAFTTDWTKSFGLLGVPLNYFFGVVGSIFNGVKGILGGILDFITGIFTGNWRQAFQGLSDIVSSIFGMIGGVIKAPINAAISGINWVISSINGIGFDVPSWVPGIGGSHFGINLPQIPMLENGGIVTKATLAMVGEGKEHEAVMPLSKLDRLVTNSVRKVMDREEPKEVKKPKLIQINVQAGTKTIAQAIFDEYGKLIKKTQRSRAIARGDVI